MKVRHIKQTVEEPNDCLILALDQERDHVLSWFADLIIELAEKDLLECAQSTPQAD